MGLLDKDVSLHIYLPELCVLLLFSVCVCCRAVAIEYFSNRVFYQKFHRLIEYSDKNYFFFLKSNPKYTRENKTSLLKRTSNFVSFLEFFLFIAQIAYINN